MFGLGNIIISCAAFSCVASMHIDKIINVLICNLLIIVQQNLDVRLSKLLSAAGTSAIVFVYFCIIVILRSKGQPVAPPAFYRKLILTCIIGLIESYGFLAFITLCNEMKDSTIQA